MVGHKDNEDIRQELITTDISTVIKIIKINGQSIWKECLKMNLMCSTNINIGQKTPRMSNKKMEETVSIL